MDKQETLIVQQAHCNIYPDRPKQMCRCVKVLIIPMGPKGEKPCPIGSEADNGWVADLTKGEPILDRTVFCSEAGYVRMRAMIENATSPPTPRTQKAAIKPGVPGIAS